MDFKCPLMKTSMKSAILTAFLITCVACQNNTSSTNRKVEILDLSAAYDQDTVMYLSAIAKDVHYIKLETDSICFISKIRDPSGDIQFSKNRVFINDKRQQLLVFDHSGKFLNKIGNIGKGPGEFISIRNYTLLLQDSLVAIFSPPQQKVFIYTFHNKYIKSIDVDFWPIPVTTINNKYLVFANTKGRRRLTDYYTLSILNLDGEVLNRLIERKLEREVEKNDEMGLGNMSYFYDFRDTLSYWEYQYNTIWRIASLNYAYPEYYLDLGKDKYPFEYLFISSGKKHNEKSNLVSLERLFESERYFFLRVIHKGHLKHILYDKKLRTCKSVKCNNGKPYFAFQNDMDGGMNFWPEGKVSENVLFTTFYAYKIKIGDTIKDTLFNEKHNTFEKLVERATINDNPVIMIVTLKQKDVTND